jgi:WD40 repeat protein
MFLRLAFTGSTKLRAAILALGLALVLLVFLLKANLANQEQSIIILRGNAGPVYSLAFSADGKVLACGSGSTEKTGIGIQGVRNVGRVTIWEIPDGKCLRTFSGTNVTSAAVRDLAFSPTGDAIVTASANETLLWDALHGEFVRELGSGSQCVKFSEDGKIVVSADGYQVRRWNLQDINASVTPIGTDGEITCASISWSSLELALGRTDGPIEVWDIETAKRLVNLIGHTERLTCLCFTRIKPMLLSGSWDGSVRLWDYRFGKELGTVCQEVSAVHCISVSPDEQLCAVGYQSGLVNIINLKRKRTACSFSAHDDWIHAVSFSPNGEMLASACHDGTVKVWRVDRLLSKLTR